MWDTAREAARVCEPMLPAVKQRTSIKRAIDAKSGKYRLRGHVKRLLFRTLPILNRQSVAEAGDAELLYLWGAFPKDSRKPFVVELDNPFVITYYRLWAFFRRRKTLIKRFAAAQAITFMSETARQHTLALLGEGASALVPKTHTLYPFTEQNYKGNRRVGDGLTRFLFVGLGFRRKGGPELLEAFSRVFDETLRLTVIAPVEDDVIERYKHDTRITFLPPQSREELFAEYYPTHDIFIFPSLLETFGVVILEALSFGMGIITTDVYATPELVTDGVNGRLLKHPFLERTQLGELERVDCITIDRSDLAAEYTSQSLYEQLVCDLKQAITQAVQDKHTWQAGSERLFNERFAPAVWEQTLTTVIGGPAADRS